MDPTERPPMADETRQQLVAYLDGELSPEECRQMEQRLANDVTLRRELQELEQAWNALDELPRETVDEDFAKTTIEMVSVAAAQDLQTQTSMLPTQQRRQRFHGFLLLTVVGLSAFLAARFGPRDPDQQLIEHLPVVLQSDTYQHVPDIEFLRELVAGPAARMRMAMFISTEELKSMLLPAPLRGSEADRRQWMAGLSLAQKHSLASKAKRFEQLSPSEQERLTQLDKRIASDPQYAQLEEALLLYAQILAEMSAGQLAALEDAPRDEFTSVLRRIALEIHGDQVALSADELSAIRRLMIRYRDAHPQQFNTILKQIESIRAIRRQARRAAQQQLPAPRRMQATVRARFRELIKLIPSELREEIVLALDEKSRARLERLAEPRRTQVLVNWMGQALQRARLKDISQEQLESFFTSDEISADRRQTLLALPTSEMLGEIEKLYRVKMNMPRDNLKRGRDLPMHRPTDRFRGRRPGDGPIRPSDVNRPPRPGVTDRVP